MFYLYQGKVCVTPATETLPEYKKMKSYCLDGASNNHFFVDMCKFIFFVYHKVDALGNKNLFNAYPMKERKEIVVEKYDLFIKAISPDNGEPFDYKKDIDRIEPLSKFINFYITHCYSESERTLEIFRQKLDHWRNMYSQLGNTPDEDKEFHTALSLAEKNLREYETKVMLETSNNEEGSDGCALYLFEIPENQKPMHVQLAYGDK